MKKTKLLLIILLIFLLIQITILLLSKIFIKDTEVEASDIVKYIQKYDFHKPIVDEETCVEYFADYGMGGNMTVRYNTDGTIKVNNRCMNEKNN